MIHSFIEFDKKRSWWCQSNRVHCMELVAILCMPWNTETFIHVWFFFILVSLMRVCGCAVHGSLFLNAFLSQFNGIQINKTEVICFHFFFLCQCFTLHWPWNGEQYFADLLQKKGNLIAWIYSKSTQAMAS